jgi:Zn-finger nucleic acid-binding protein
MSERHGIEIDYCPNCRGVWLDRGELDKIIEREQGGSGRYQNDPPARAPQPRYAESHDQPYRPDRHDRYEERREHYDDRGHDQGHGYGHGKRRKKSFLGDLFDFD